MGSRRSMGSPHRVQRNRGCSHPPQLTRGRQGSSPLKPPTLDSLASSLLLPTLDSLRAPTPPLPATTPPSSSSHQEPRSQSLKLPGSCRQPPLWLLGSQRPVATCLAQTQRRLCRRRWGRRHRACPTQLTQPTEALKPSTATRLIRLSQCNQISQGSSPLPTQASQGTSPPSMPPTLGNLRSQGSSPPTRAHQGHRPLYIPPTLASRGSSPPHMLLRQVRSLPLLPPTPCKQREQPPRHLRHTPQGWHQHACQKQIKTTNYC